MSEYHQRFWLAVAGLWFGTMCLGVIYFFWEWAKFKGVEL